MAADAGVDVEMLRKAMLEEIEKIYKAIKLYSFAMDVSKAEYKELPNGTSYARLPTTAVIEVRNGTRLLNSTHSLAIFDDNKWYLLRIDDVGLVEGLGEADPEYAGIEFPSGTTKILDPTPGNSPGPQSAMPNSAALQRGHQLTSRLGCCASSTSSRRGCGPWARRCHRSEAPFVHPLRSASMAQLGYNQKQGQVTRFPYRQQLLKQRCAVLLVDNVGATMLLAQEATRALLNAEGAGAAEAGLASASTTLRR